ncbi:MAG: hypothetical protein ACLQVI_20300 [Polyangiaceae bacterium]
MATHPMAIAMSDAIRAVVGAVTATKPGRPAIGARRELPLRATTPLC